MTFRTDGGAEVVRRPSDSICNEVSAGLSFQLCGTTWERQVALDLRVILLKKLTFPIMLHRSLQFVRLKPMWHNVGRKLLVGIGLLSRINRQPMTCPTLILVDDRQHIGAARLGRQRCRRQAGELLQAKTETTQLMARAAIECGNRFAEVRLAGSISGPVLGAQHADGHVHLMIRVGRHAGRHVQMMRRSRELELARIDLDRTEFGMMLRVKSTDILHGG